MCSDSVVKDVVDEVFLSYRRSSGVITYSNSRSVPGPVSFLARSTAGTSILVPHHESSTANNDTSPSHATYAPG